MLSERALTLGGSQTSGMRNRARKLRAQGVHVVNFAAGELDQDTSESIKVAVRQAVDSGRTQYTDTLGMEELREALARKVAAKTAIPYSKDEVGFTAGAKQALFGAAMVAFQPGDEVIIPAPYWVTFPDQIRLAGATPVFLPTGDTQFQIDVDRLASRITSRTRGIILNTPHNPTGAVYGAQSLARIARLILAHRLTCIFDECYEELVYPPDVHSNIVKLVPEMKDQTILVGSFSKSHCIAGWRAGFVAGPQAVIKAISNFQSHTASNPSSLVQYAALAALAPGSEAFVEGIREQLRQQRQIALRLLAAIPGLSCVLPTGAFYLFPDVSKLLGRTHEGRRLESVDMLAEQLLEQAHVAVVAGSAFGSDRHVRLSYALPVDEMTLGFEHLAALLGKLE